MQLQRYVRNKIRHFNPKYDRFDRFGRLKESVLRIVDTCRLCSIRLGAFSIVQEIEQILDP